MRHEEVAAFAVSAQAQLSGMIGVCMGTVGPGSIHLLNGLYDAKKSHAPVLAICGQVPSPEIGTDFFQEVDNDALFADVSVFAHTLTSPAQLPHLLEQAVNAAYAQRGVAVLTLPGDVGGHGPAAARALPRFAPPAVPVGAPRTSSRVAVEALTGADVTLLVGCGAREARERGARAGRHARRADGAHPQGEGGPGARQPVPGRAVRADRQPGGRQGDGRCDVLFLIGTDFPYRDWYPSRQDGPPARRTR